MIEQNIHGRESTESGNTRATTLVTGDDAQYNRRAVRCAEPDRTATDAMCCVAIDKVQRALRVWDIRGYDALVVTEVIRTCNVVYEAWKAGPGYFCAGQQMSSRRSKVEKRMLTESDERLLQVGRFALKSRFIEDADYSDVKGVPVSGSIKAWFFGNRLFGREVGDVNSHPTFNTLFYARDTPTYWLCGRVDQDMPSSRNIQVLRAEAVTAANDYPASEVARQLAVRPLVEALNEYGLSRDFLTESCSQVRSL